MKMDVIICDDLREEISGKLTFVGVYGEYLATESFPVSLANLCFIWRIRGKRPLPKKVDISIKSSLLEDTIHTELSLADEGKGANDRDYLLNFPMRATGLSFASAGELIFEAIVDGEEMEPIVFPIIEQASKRDT